jgi:membrane-associated protease RseP (regulator of RpoE activity)
MSRETFRISPAQHVIAFGATILLGVALAMAQAPKDRDQRPVQPNAAQPNATRPSPGATANRAADARPDAERDKARRRGHMLGFEVDGRGDQGLRVTSVEGNSTAAQAGLKQNDRIVSVDGRPFVRGRQLQAYLGGQAGRQIPIIIERDGRQYTIQFTPGDLPDDSAWLGVYLEEGDANNKGARITHIYPAGPAARAGLYTGDIITQIGDQKIDDSGDLVATVQGMEPNARAEFVVLRNDRETKLPVTLGSRDSFVARHQEPHWQGNGENRTYAQNYQQNYQQRDDFSDVPPYAMQLEQDRRNAEQHQRIEDEIRLLREEIAKLREEIRKK